MVQADVVQVDAAARHFVVYISASVEEYIHVGLFATVRGTFKCLHALASRPEEKRIFSDFAHAHREHPSDS